METRQRVASLEIVAQVGAKPAYRSMVLPAPWPHDPRRLASQTRIRRNCAARHGASRVRMDGCMQVNPLPADARAQSPVVFPRLTSDVIT